MTHDQPQLCGFSHRRPRGLRAKEPISDTELWFLGYTWLLGGAAPRKPKVPDPQHLVRFGGPHPAIAGNLVPLQWSAPGCPGIGGLDTQPRGLEL